MKIQPYVNKLQNSSPYKEFQQKNKDAFLAAGFFVIDFETGKNIHQIDYFVPSKKKFAAFTLDEKVIMQLFDSLDRKAPEKLDINVNVDLDALKGILVDEMKNRGITEDIRKMIVVLQNIKGKKIWNVSCILSGMELMRAHVDDDSKTILRMDKSSLMDYIKRMPQLPGAAPKQAEVQAGKPSQEELSKKIEQLDKLKKALEKEQESVKKASSKKSK